MQQNFRKLMFVCAGNTSRSPMAEAIFRSLFRSSGPHYMIDDPKTRAMVEVSSSGVVAWGDEPYSTYAVTVSRLKYGEDLSSGYSKIAIYERLCTQDLILCVEESLADYLRTKHKRLADRIFSLQGLLDKYHIDAIDGEVVDPHGKDSTAYFETAEQIDMILRALIPEILKEWGMK